MRKKLEFHNDKSKEWRGKSLNFEKECHFFLEKIKK